MNLCDVFLQSFVIHFKNSCVLTPLQLPVKSQSELIKVKQKSHQPFSFERKEEKELVSGKLPLLLA